MQCSEATVDGTNTYYCTLDAGHEPPNEHRCDYRELDPNNFPMTRPASYSWTTPA